MKNRISMLHISITKVNLAEFTFSVINVKRKTGQLFSYMCNFDWIIIPPSNNCHFGGQSDSYEDDLFDLKFLINFTFT